MEMHFDFDEEMGIEGGVQELRREGHSCARECD